MLQYQNIRDVHLEISTKCNAACPGCPRNVRGVDIKTDYPRYSMTIQDAQQIFTQPFLNQLDTIFINGNLGDFVAAKDGMEIVRYFRQSNSQLKVIISTNASTKAHIWEELAELGTTVYFCIDGLEDTHHLYRQNTSFDLILSNAKRFIDNGGGTAFWKMIEFGHNKHQVDQCRKLSEQMGFDGFFTQDNNRDSFPVFTPKGEYSHDIGIDLNEPRDFSAQKIRYENLRRRKGVPYEMEPTLDPSVPISCESITRKSIYVSAIGEVFPCCYIGFFPSEMAMRDNQNILQRITSNNNAREVGLEKSIEWFNNVFDSFNTTPLRTCQKTCGG
jgi:MoaA/NifB/PqqE/SkfB family radical SAM enzyme